MPDLVLVRDWDASGFESGHAVYERPGEVVQIGGRPFDRVGYVYNEGVLSHVLLYSEVRSASHDDFLACVDTFAVAKHMQDDNYVASGNRVWWDGDRYQVLGVITESGEVLLEVKSEHWSTILPKTTSSSRPSP